MTAEYAVRGSWDPYKGSFREYVEVLAATFAEGIVANHLLVTGSGIEVQLTASKVVIGDCDCGGYCDHLDPARRS